MRPSKKLFNLQKAACKRLTRLRDLAQRVAINPSLLEREAGLAFVVIETLNTWSNFSRSYYLSCILCPITINGVKVTVNPRGLTFNDAIGLAIISLKPRATPLPSGLWHRRDEPAWHDSNNLIRFCNGLTCSNINDVRAAFSTGSRVFMDLPVFRNFYGHRNLQTQSAAMQLAPQYGIPATFRPSEILLSQPLGRPQKLIFDMIDDLTFTIEYLCH